MIDHEDSGHVGRYPVYRRAISESRPLKKKTVPPTPSKDSTEEGPPRRAIRNRNPDAVVYHAAYDVSAKWPTAICIEFDVIAQGTSREAAMDNLEAAIEMYLGIPENSVRVEPAKKS